MLSPAEHFLLDFHDRLPGGSSRAFAGLPVADDQGLQHADTYQALVQRLQAGPTPPGAVLDLACGDGHLLALLRASGRPLLGADASRGELAAARSRLGEAVPLHQARALDLPLADASVAAITCHMALMLMEAPQRVLAELRRVLQPGGRLLAVVPAAPGTADPATLAFMAALQTHPQRRSEWQGVQFGSAHWRGADALRKLLQTDFPQPRLTHLSGARRLTPALAWQWFTGLYDLHLRPDTAWGPAHALFLDRLTPQCDADGQTRLQHTYLMIDAATPRAKLP